MDTQLHPIVAQLRPSLEQIPAITARGSDVAVTAGAGAGKTRTLVAYYLALLCRVPMHAVVAITFTKKAAREMRNRVREAVRRYVERPDLTPEEISRWQALYTGLDAARIGTIHSLCAEILRHHPAEAEIDPRFEMLDEGQQALLQAQAVDEALGRAADDPQLARLFGDFGEAPLRHILSELLQRRLDVETARTRLPDLWSIWESHLLPPIRAFVQDTDVQQALAELQTLRDAGVLARAAEAGDAFAPLLPEILAHWAAIRAAQAAGDWVAASAHLHPLRQALKQKGSKANWKPADPKPLVKELQERFDEHLAAWKERHFDLALDRELAQAILPALLGLYDVAQRRYEQTKNARRALDFDDLEQRALTLLQTHPAVRAYWQDEIAALLVDEFQDTNDRQRELLNLLDGGRGKRFIVGDGKQSIYRFRGADVTVFRQVWQETEQRGQTFTLATSYRAHRALIAGLNALLKPVLGEADPARPYVEPFAPLCPHRENPVAGLTPPFIELHLAAGAKKDGALARAAQALANRLQDLVGSGVQVEETDLETGRSVVRPLDYGDIAILCRATSSFAPYENALEAAGIPFLTVVGRGFYERPEVRDVLNALQSIADPTDDLALAGLLRSPVCGLSDMALYRLRQTQQEQKLPSLWAALSEIDLADLEGALSEIDLADLESAVSGAAAAYELVARLHALAGRVPVADVLKAFLDATDYRAALLRAGQARGAGNLAKLLADAHASEIVGVGAFLEYVQQLRDAGTREGEARTVARGVVQLLTVHAAKGLEFPIVVLGDVTHDRPSVRGVLIDPALGLIPPVETEGAGQKARSAIYALAQERAEAQEAAESDRLLYVAATRAQELLLFSGTFGRGQNHWLARLPLALPLPESDTVQHTDLDLDGVPVAYYGYPEEASIPLRTASLAPAQAVAWPEALPLLESLHPESQIADESARQALQDPPPRAWRIVPLGERATAPAWVAGKVVHGALEQWLFPDGTSAGPFYRWAEAEVRGCGIADEVELSNAIRRAARMLERFQVTPLHDEMSAASHCLREAPYSLLTAQGIEHGVIDALFETAAGWTLVEFKTDRVDDAARLEQLLAQEDYIPQVARYLAAAERLLGVRPRPVLCFLNYAGAVRLVEDRWGQTGH
ncbi:MAG: UvrD-helicase domain-containing protein [Anaerolineae bacterium]|nr:UvrD-helicase domain-containing protein [Anaerolineae bacterium]